MRCGIFNYLAISLFLILITLPVIAEDHLTGVTGLDPVVSNDNLERDYVNYPSSYFERYQPITALDMVNQVPGFQLDDDIEDIRGFGETVGNILINDRRPSAKQDNLSAILRRIPADTVERVELIRGQVRNIDLRGQSTLVNLILRQNTPAAVQWQAHLERRFNYGSIAPAVTISLTDKWRDIEYNIGLDGQYQPFGRTGMDEIFTSTGDLSEIRFDGVEIRNNFLKGNFNTVTDWGETLVQFNSSFRYDKHTVATISQRVPQLAGSTPREDIVNEFDDGPSFETGVDAERSLSNDLTGKVIFLYNWSRSDILSTQRNINKADIQTLSRKPIARLIHRRP